MIIDFRVTLPPEEYLPPGVTEVVRREVEEHGARGVNLQPFAYRLPCNHGGWPWVTEMVAVAWKHSNMYIEIGAISPKYTRSGTGWEPLLVYGNSLIQDRVLWATDSMLPFDRSLEEARNLPLKPEVLEKWLGGNAARLLRLPAG